MFITAVLPVALVVFIIFVTFLPKIKENSESATVKQNATQQKQQSTNKAFIVKDLLAYDGIKYTFTYQEAINEGMAGYYRPVSIKDRENRSSFIVNIHETRPDETEQETVERVANAIVSENEARGGIILTPFVATDNSGKHGAYFVTLYFLYPNEGFGELFLTKVGATKAKVYSIFYRREFSGADDDKLKREIESWLTENLDVHGKEFWTLTLDDFLYDYDWDEVGDYCSPELPESICKYLSLRDFWEDSFTVADVTGNGVPDYLVEVCPKLSNCQARSVFFFEDNELYFEYNGDDAGVFSTDEDGSVVIREPIRLEGEAMCCPSTFKYTDIKCIESKQIYCEIL